MKVAFVIRSTFASCPGGDTVQVLQTAAHLRRLGIEVDICKASDRIDYRRYNLLHFFNLTRPADILGHLRRAAGLPVVLSPIFIDYSAFDRQARRLPGHLLLRLLSSDRIEYIKTLARALKGTDRLCSPRFLWKGQQASIREILQRTQLLLPASEAEAAELQQRYGQHSRHQVLMPGIDTDLFRPRPELRREEDLVICVARIEGLKNQLNLVRALNNTRFRLLLIGAPAPNQPGYFEACRRMAAANVQFTGPLPQEELAAYYARAAVHVLPGYFENCGLATLEAAGTGCPVVVSRHTYITGFLGEEGFYCHPDDPASILKAVEAAAGAPRATALSRRVHESCSWEGHARALKAAYAQVATDASTSWPGLKEETTTLN